MKACAVLPNIRKLKTAKTINKSRDDLRAKGVILRELDINFSILNYPIGNYARLPQPYNGASLGLKAFRVCLMLFSRLGLFATIRAFT